MKKKVLIFLIISFILCLFGFSSYFIKHFFGLNYSQKAVYENGDYKIIIKGNEPKGFFGGEDLIIYAKKGYTTFKYKTEISNDGKRSNESNFLVNWKEDKAILTIMGEEQKNEYLEINFTTKKINHHKIIYNVIKEDNDIPIIKKFNYREIETDFISYGISVNDENGDSLLPYGISKFMITLDYEKEEGKATIEWYEDGNAYVYKNDELTLIECMYDRNNPDYENIIGERYYKYILGPKDLKYDYSLCKPNK